MAQQHINVPPENHVSVLDGQGWVGLIDTLGTEATIVNAARVSFGKIIALANMSFRTGTPYPSMPVLGNVVLMPYPQGYASLTLGCLTLAAPSGLVYWQIRVCPDVKFFACV